MTARHSHIIEGRWEQSEDRDYFLIDILAGSTLDEAKEYAGSYMHSRRVMGSLTWLDGDPDKNGPVLYAYTPAITLRVRR